jgi:hypothetical protein
MDERHRVLSDCNLMDGVRRWARLFCGSGGEGWGKRSKRARDCAEGVVKRGILRFEGDRRRNQMKIRYLKSGFGPSVTDFPDFPGSVAVTLSGLVGRPVAMHQYAPAAFLIQCIYRSGH